MKPEDEPCVRIGVLMDYLSQAHMLRYYDLWFLLHKRYIFFTCKKYVLPISLTRVSNNRNGEKVKCVLANSLSMDSRKNLKKWYHQSSLGMDSKKNFEEVVPSEFCKYELKENFEEVSPPMVVVEDDTPPYKISGFAVEMFDILMKYIGRCYEWVVPEDRLYGHQLPNGSWTGLIEYIVNGEWAIIFYKGPHEKSELCQRATPTKADIALPLSITSDRLRAVEFTEIVVMEEFVVSYKRPDLQSDITGFIKPFAPMVWLTVLLAALVVCALTWVILRAQSKLTRKAESEVTGEMDNMDKVTVLGQRSLLWTMSHLISQRKVFSVNSVIGGLWLLVAFVLVSVYRGNLKAMLILPKVELPFNSLQELARSDVRVWSPGNHIALQMIMAAPPDSVYGLIAQRSYTHMRIAEGVQLVYEGKHAAVTLMLAALDNMDKTFSRTSACPLYVVAERFLKTNSMGLPIRKGSELKPKLDRAITRLREFGILEHIIQKKLANGTICMKPLSHTVTAGALRPLDIVDFFGVFAIYAGESPNEVKSQDTKVRVNIGSQKPTCIRKTQHMKSKAKIRRLESTYEAKSQHMKAKSNI
ncbi:glutamate receptor ionotropic, delta-2-like [Penaeus vannamei]|uniref:glutamate receptor ionotropic, delta-2-like n=1 Tax=Penaeus vannamei TaxID=6689 RepID=UPI00387F4237